MKTIVTSSKARTNRRYSLLGACGFLAITVIQVPNVADLCKQLRSQHVHRAKMLDDDSGPDRIAQMQKQLERVKTELETIGQSMIGIDRMPAIQSELMELARSSGCQLRKAVIQAGSSEIWEAEKLAPSEEEEAEQRFIASESPFSLTTEQLSLSLTGTLAQTFDFLDRVRQRTWLMRVAQINFSRDPDGGGQLIVEANLAFYKLVHQEKSTSESVKWREGSRAKQIH